MWYYVYILKLSNGLHYYGCTVDLKKRLIRHGNGDNKFTKNLRPVQLIWCCAFPSRFEAYKFEKYLKSGSGRAFALKRLIKSH